MLEFPGESSGLLMVMGILLGLLVGSFLNVVSHRLPLMMQRDWSRQCWEYLEISVPISGKVGTESDPHDRSDSIDHRSEAVGGDSHAVFNLAWPASHCPTCGHRIRLWENIPVFSYLLLGGKCSSCKTRISLRYPLLELLSGLLTGLIAYCHGPSLLTGSLLILTWSLLALAIIDLEHQLLPDNITLPLLWLGLLVNAVDLGLGVSLFDAVIGASAGYLSLWGCYCLFKLATGKEGMGYGDFKLLAALGAWLGWQSLLPILLMSSLTGAATGISLMLVAGRDRTKPMPFGPFLTAAGIVMLAWGNQLTTIYLDVLCNL